MLVLRGEKWNHIKLIQKYRQFKAKVKALSSRFYLNSKANRIQQRQRQQAESNRQNINIRGKNANHLHTISGYAKKINGNGVPKTNTYT